MLDYIDEKPKAALIRKAIADIILEGKVKTYDMLKMAGKPDVINKGAATTRHITDAIIAKLQANKLK
jgi:3-isopropylmalate dehydrogenase